MIQWDRDLIQENDSVIQVRCERPDNFNRTARFDLPSVVEERQGSVVQKLPGPNKLSMELHEGVGESAPALLGPVVLGQQLSLVFVVMDDTLSFDCNVISCVATDGN